MPPLIWARYYAKVLGATWDNAWNEGLRAKYTRKKPELGKIVSQKNAVRMQNFANNLIGMLHVVSASERSSVQKK
jgi:hypothetical protein